MDNASILSKTAKGLAALSEKTPDLSREQYRLLGMVDGRTNLAELTKKASFSQKLAEQIASRLLAKRLVNEVPVSSQLNDFQAADAPIISVVELDPEESVRAWAEAQRGAKGLHDEGFYAHKIRPMQVERQQPRILSVEDDPLMARMLTLLLTNEGFKVRHAADGRSMLSALNQSIPDLVILDVMLPDISGFKILEWIRSQPRLANLPTIMLTAQVGEEDVMRGLRAGADGYIFKPFSPEPLLQCIRSILKL